MPDTALPQSDAPEAIRAVLTAPPPRASAFIVTIYGDAVEPRGGILWMGTLIDCCAAHGISESLVRTAVSRLVGAGRLEGERIGRKSYYRLSEPAQQEFRAASRILFAPPPLPEDWLVSLASEPRDGALPEGWARLGPLLALAPAREDLAWPEGVVLRADSVAGLADLPGIAAQHWPLAEVAAAYARFLDRYAPVAAQPGAMVALGEAEALALRLRLVHDYRHAALPDPRLPAAARPADWPAATARRVFLATYLALTAAADRHVGVSFMDPDGPLPAETAATDTRLARLRAEAEG